MDDPSVPVSTTPIEPTPLEPTPIEPTPPSAEPPFPIAPTAPPATDDFSIPPPPPEPPAPPEAGEAAGLPVSEPIFKRLLPLILGLGVLLLLVLLVTKVILPRFQKSSAPEVVTLKYWGLWEPENIMAQIIDDYRQTHPNVTIQYTRQSQKDYRERLQSALARGDGPDIFRFHNTWLPMLRADLSPVPDDIYSPNEFDTTFYPIAKKDLFVTNNYYGIPLMFDSLALYVNEDIFKSDPTLKIPTTWDNLRQTAFKLKQVNPTTGKLTRGGVAMGAAGNVDNFSDILGLMILQNGGDPGNATTDAVISAIKFYTLFVTQDGTWSQDLPNSTFAFANQKVAMMIAPSWRALEVKALNPQLNFRLYPAPQLPGTNVTWASYWVEGVSQKSPSQKAAWEFLKYLSSKETLTKMHSLAAQSRLFGEPYSRQDMAASLQQDPFLGAIVSQALSSQSYPLASRTFDNGLNDKMIKYYEDAINGLLKNDNQKTITDNLSAGVAQVLSQYGLTNR